MTVDLERSPLITHIAWGEITVEALRSGRDMKLWPGGGRAWDWSETNTHHSPGIQIADVEELLERGARAIVLTRGMELMLETCPETLLYLEGRGIEVQQFETKDAVRSYNELARRGVPVGGLFHSTC